MRIEPEIYVTKWALTDGIVRFENAEISEAGYAWVKRWPNSYTATVPRAHWSTSADKAIASAESMRVKNIASLQKQIAKLEKLKIKIVEAKQ